MNDLERAQVWLRWIMATALVLAVCNLAGVLWSLYRMTHG